MKKILCIVTLLLVAIYPIIAQDGSSGSDTSADLILFPTSPEAGKLGTFGNVPVNLSAGQMNYEIPLHTIQVNEYSWPITLRYNYGGLLLEDKPSLSGMGWNLSVGGTVVREVRGLPDEHPRGYYGSQNYRSTYLIPYFNTGEITENTADQILAGRMDSEPDKYTVSVNGINFSFKIDENQNPVYLSKHNYKVSITWLSGYIHRIDKVTLIDDKGYTYVFDVKERNEPIQGNEVVFNDSFTGYTSSWMLSKVVFPNNEQITFNYIENSYQSLDFYASGFYSYNIPVIQCQGGDLSNAPLFGYSDGFAKTLIKRQILASIMSPSGNVFLLAGTNQDRVTYNAVVINNSEQKKIAGYRFFYEGGRDVLTKITKNSQRYYDFEYLDKDLIPGFYTTGTSKPYAQDIWGFYNGIGNTHAINIPYTQYGASKHATNKVKIGALTKIIYPTGGYSLVDYEPNQTKQKYTTNSEQVLPPNIELNMLFKSDNQYSNYKETSITHEFKTDVYATISHSITSNNNGTIFASINRLDDCPVYKVNPFGGNYATVASYYRETENVEVPKFCPALGIQLDDSYSGSSKTLSGNSGGYIKIPKGTYKFKIHTNSNLNYNVYGHMKIQFHQVPDVAPGQTLYMNAAIGGIRVKSIKEFDSANKVIKQRFFNYNDQDGYSTGFEVRKAVRDQNYQIELSCTNGINQLIYRYDRVNFTYKTFNPVNLNSGVPVYYRNVKEYEEQYTKTIPSYVEAPIAPVNYDGSRRIRVLEDTYATKKHYYPKGYTKTIYEDPKLFYDSQYPSIPNGIDQSIGRVANTTVHKFNATDSLHPVVSKTNQSYTHIRGLVDQDGNDYNPLHPKGLKIGYKIKKEGILHRDTYIHDYYLFKTYKEYDSKFLPEVKETIQYYPEPIKTVETNTYDSYNQLSVSKIVDSNGKTHTKEVLYPYDINEPVYTAMTQQNVIATPVQTTSKVDGTTLASSKTEFYNLGGLLFKPKTKLSSKSTNALEARLRIDTYDSKGNIQQYHSITNDNNTGNRYTSIIWGYAAQYPIAKIENATIPQIATALGVPENTVLNFTETSLPTLHTLREVLPNAMVTTYTYDPLIGVTSITDPKGYTVYYEYDEMHRLKYIKDADGNLVSKNTYHYKNQ